MWGRFVRVLSDTIMSETVQFRVTNFDCPTCASTVERALTKLGGVEDAAVHFTTGRIEVEYDESVITSADIERTIEKRGYSPGPA